MLQRFKDKCREIYDTYNIEFIIAMLVLIAFWVGFFSAIL